MGYEHHEGGTAVTKGTQRRQVMRRGDEAPAVPDEISIALTEIVSSAREGLLAFAVGTGLQVMQQLMDEQVTAPCGPPGARARAVRPRRRHHARAARGGAARAHVVEETGRRAGNASCTP